MQIHAHTHARILVYMPKLCATGIFICMYVFLHVYIYIYIYIYMYICTHIRTYICPPMYIFTHINMNIHIYTHAKSRCLLSTRRRACHPWIQSPTNLCQSWRAAVRCRRQTGLCVCCSRRPPLSAAGMHLRGASEFITVLWLDFARDETAETC